VVICARESAKRLGQQFRDARIVIQGFGNVGYWAAKLASEAGARVVAVSDVAGGAYNPNGLDVDAVARHLKEQLSVTSYPDADAVENDELIELECDILVPAAIQGVIHSGNADRIKASLLVEAANGPTSPVADRMLQERGIPVVPDILANAGGVTVSYFEWVQNIQQFRWDLDQVNFELKKRVTRATEQVFTRAEEQSTSLRAAAFDLAVGRVARAAEIRGYF